jgi:mannose/fructose/N-acetylgalactosamine-specific phosphotransferase system component IIC
MVMGWAHQGMVMGWAHQVMVMGWARQGTVMGWAHQVMVMGWARQGTVMGWAHQVMVMGWRSAMVGKNRTIVMVCFHLYAFVSSRHVCTSTSQISNTCSHWHLSCVLLSVLYLT